MSGASAHRLAGALALALVCVQTSPAAQDLVADGGFDQGLSAWRVSGEGSAATSSEDIDDDPSSGSVLLRNAQDTAGSRSNPIDQCIAIEAPGEYFLGASARIAPGQVPGRAVISYVLFRGPACDGSIGGGGGRFVPADDDWTSIETSWSNQEYPLTLWLRLGVDKPGADGTLEVQFDDVYLIRGDRLFRSGFE